MADEQRSIAELAAALADNVSKNIKPQDARDLLVSLRPAWGQLAVLAADSGDVVITDTANYFEMNAVAWTHTTGHLFDESAANGRQTYIGTKPMNARVTAVVSMNGIASDILHLRLGKNAVTDPNSEVQVKVGLSGDVEAVFLQMFTEVTTGDYVSPWIRNETATDDVTIKVANIQSVALIK